MALFMEKKKILVVDDEYYIIDLIKRDMEVENYKIISASNGKDAIDMATEEKPDIILLDIMLPRISGMDVCKILKESPGTYDIPIILLTCRSEMEMKLLGIDWGADDYITKPFDLRELRAKIKALLRLVTLQKNLHRTSRLQVVGELAAGMTHEFKNVLTSIKCWIGMKKAFKNKKLEPEELEELEELCNRGEKLIVKLLSLSRDQKIPMHSKNINTVIENSLSLIYKILKSSSINLNWLPEENLPAVMVNEDSFAQVILNLILNSRDAMPYGGEITIKTYGENDWVKIDVSDTGAGIKKDIIDEIFEPFFSTREISAKGKTSGTGLGLSVSYGIIKKHQGTIEVNSEFGKGATFTISLPVRKVEENVN